MHGARGPDTVLIVHNVSKKNNIRSLFTACHTFGASLALVKHPGFTEDAHVPQEVRGLVHLERFGRLTHCVDALRGRGYVIWGIEIDGAAADVEHCAWPARVALLPGNEGHGLSDAQRAVCDGFVMLKQFGRGTASLNVSVAASIVLQRRAAAREEE